MVIPTLNESGHVEQLLAQLQPLRARGHELILVDGGSTDNTLLLAENRADKILQCKPGRARQLNHGAKAATGDVLWFVHVDTVIPPNADTCINEALRNSGRVWGRFNISLSGRHPLFRIIETMMNLRSRLSGIATGDQGIFVIRSAFESAGGFREIALMEDICISQQMKQQSRPVCLRSRLISSSRRWEQHGILKTVLLMWWLRLAFFLGVRADTLARWYSYKTIDSARAAILVFAKAPEPGKVMTRLIPALGEKGAANLHAHMLESSIQRLKDLPGIDVQLWCAPDTSHALFTECRVRYGISLHSQEGADLGERMSHAFNKVLKDYGRVVLIGTDCPELNADDIRESLDKLEQGCDAVLGPAIDGGYVLIALRQSSPYLFQSMQWGSDHVLNDTRDRLRALGWRWHELSERHDIDRPEDLDRHPELTADTGLISCKMG